MKKTQAEYDRERYEQIKADPVKLAAYREKKRNEARARRKAGTMTPSERGPHTPATREQNREIRRRWRASHPEHARLLLQANHAIELAILRGDLVRPPTCSECCRDSKRIEAHHHKGYAREHWLDVVWLCKKCHMKADRFAQ